MLAARPKILLSLGLYTAFLHYDHTHSSPQIYLQTVLNILPCFLELDFGSCLGSRTIVVKLMYPYLHLRNKYKHHYVFRPNLVTLNYIV
jgi:hypothetical protein